MTTATTQADLPSLFITPFSRLSIGASIGAGLGAPASGTFTAANACVYYPFRLSQPAVLKKFFWLNGATVGTNNIQMAVYREDFTRVVLGNSTLSAGTANQVQEDDIADVLLDGPARYYMAIAANGNTATLFRSVPSAVIPRVLGVAQQSTAFPPPDPMVPVAFTAAHIYVCGLALRTLVA